MILLSTKFPVIPEFTADVLASMLQDWILESHHYNLPVDYKGESEYDIVSDDEKQVLRIVRTEDKFAAQFSCTDDNSVYVNTYILSSSGETPLVFVQLTKELLKPTPQSYSPLRIPKLMRRIFWEEYGGMDGQILTDDKSLIIRKNNVDIAKKIVLNEELFVNPIVYVSPYLDTGKYATNYEKLASDLLGVAHVVVEGSPYISNVISEATNGENPKDGSVAIFLPTGEKQMFVPKDMVNDGVNNMTKNITTYVRDMMSVVTPGDDFSFQKIRYNYLLSKATELSGGNKELEQLCEDMLADKDSELASLRDELDKCKQDLYTANSKVESLQNALSVSKDDVTGISLSVSEEDLYLGEIKDVILKVLEKEYKAINTDNKAGKSRKAAVLKDILDNNEQTGKDDEIRKVFKESVKDGTLSPDKMSEVERLGFHVSMNGDRHYKVTFNGDARYQISIATTPSDHRAGENLTTTFMNMLFGY